MSGLLLFVFTIVVVVFIVQIGAIAFELTGMTWQQARFQALSCFTGTGYTTRESELVSRNPQRRKIASGIMILGHAGDLSLIATFVNYLRTVFGEGKSVHYIPFTDISVPLLIWQFGKLLLIIIIIYIIHKYFFRSMLWKKFTVGIKRKLEKGKLVANTTFEEVNLGDSNYGVLRMVIKADDKYVNKTIGESRFKELTGAQILTIERKNKMIPNPSPDMILKKDDVLYCFGKQKMK
ncbi:MAG: TrkA C-terminal domain-containing protein [Victivallales bacterium]|nr:TrkA C-terminal domain-containing protein [Victivallales bacterium]